MAKKGINRFMVLTAAAAAAVAGISYLKKYRSFNRELDEEFHDFEDEENPVPDSTMSRNYVSLHADKDELFVAAGDMLNAAKDVAGAAKNVMMDAAAIVADTTREAMGAAVDTASAAKNSFAKSDAEEDVFNDENQLSENADTSDIVISSEETNSDQPVRIEDETQNEKTPLIYEDENDTEDL